MMMLKSGRALGRSSSETNLRSMMGAGDSVPTTSSPDVNTQNGSQSHATFQNQGDIIRGYNPTHHRDHSCAHEEQMHLSPHSQHTGYVSQPSPHPPHSITNTIQNPNMVDYDRQYMSYQHPYNPPFSRASDRFAGRSSGQVGQSYSESFHKTRRAMEPATYNGTGSVEEYIENFEKICEWNRWDLDEMAMQLLMHLQGSAKLAVKALPDSATRDYLKLVATLYSSFGDPNQAIIDQKDFWTRERNANESLVDFAHSLRNLGKKCFQNFQGDSGPAFEKMLVSRFVNGIANVDLGRWVFMRDPHTLNEAVSIARDFEAYDKLNVGSLHTSQYGGTLYKPKPANPPSHTNDTYVGLVCKDNSPQSNEMLSLLKEIANSQKEMQTEITNIKQQLKQQSGEIAAVKAKVEENTKSIRACESRIQAVEGKIRNSNNQTSKDWNQSRNNGQQNYRSGYNKGYNGGNNRGQNGNYNGGNQGYNNYVNRFQGGNDGTSSANNMPVNYSFAANTGNPAATVEQKVPVQQASSIVIAPTLPLN